MAERHRSKHGGRDTDRILGEDGDPTQGGAAGGDLAREIGARDHLKRAFERPAGATRVRGSDTPEDDRKD
ncbi:hypothetical protein P2H44_20540 [Albimonas sp. CAU 1670]|uniref:hypothetical protein n=1 Tax=Albimonas sp. CAU 1670 TaxID=3032599 RepID=UPI0023D9CCD6|nr:hypothetical protein [Albimonas sp. CAU 1670]MDF2234956.1 hypothetical protein [Albimonas sp. CAU 1670]